MAVTPSYREYVLEQLGRVAPVSARSMFGGVGIYSDGLFFALMDNDTLYFKTDGVSRPDFEAAGMPPFRPFGEGTQPMHYHELPAELLEDPEELRPWVEKALQVARRAKKRKQSPTHSRPDL
ncbi:MAG TPA: TfoX/Sxy family protein [Longimicrobiaceae bacterium]|nr:TfoX/Sxy family protein [Longimicrobiaceae bacterium]